MVGHTTRHVRARITEHATTCDITREQGTSYDQSNSTVGTIDVAISGPTSASSVVTEGTDEDTSLEGLVVPPDSGAIGLEIGDTLVPQTDTAKRYRVRTIDGYPEDIDADIYVLGLDRATTSTV